MTRVDLRRLVPVSEMRGFDASDTAELERMLAEAERYLASHDWCPPIKSRHFGFGIGGVVAVFLFTFEKRIKDRDDCVWVVVGDLPSDPALYSEFLRSLRK